MSRWRGLILGTAILALALVAGFIAQRNRTVPGATEGRPTPGADFTLLTSEARPGEETKVTLQAPRAQSFTVLIGDLTYDASRLRLKDCAVSEGIDASGAMGNTLNVFEPAPGQLRAVLTGAMHPLPEGSEWFTCRFMVAGDATAGPAAVKLNGDAADTSFEDRLFVVGGNVVIRN